MADKTNIERRTLISAASGAALSFALTSNRAGARSLDAITSADFGHFEEVAASLSCSHVAVWHISDLARDPTFVQ
jgi:hypothetical protein